MEAFWAQLASARVIWAYVGLFGLRVSNSPLGLLGLLGRNAATLMLRGQRSQLLSAGKALEA